MFRSNPQVAFVPALFFAVVHVQFVTHLVAQIGTALFVRVVGVLAVNTAELEALSLVLRGALLVVMFVVIMAAIVAELALLTSTMMMTIIVVVTLSI
jgi:hypothetical protein